MAFKVGDILRGKEEPFNTYGITNSNAVVEVVEVRKDGRLDVQIVEHDKYPEHVGGTFTVEARCFEYEDKEGAEYGL